MLSKKYIPIVFFVLINICYANNNYLTDEKDTIVAKIGQDYIVTFKDLTQYVNDWQYNVKYRNKTVAYNLAINALVINQMKRFDFFDRRLNENKDLMRSLNRIINEEISVEYFKKMLELKYVNENEAQNAYKAMDKEVDYYQIVLPLHGDENKATRDSLLVKAMKIQNDMSNAKDVEKYVIKYLSEKVKHLEPKTVKWEQSLKDPVTNVVFNLKKGFTRVIQNIDGLYIVKVTGIKKISLKPFDTMKSDILSKLKDTFFPVLQNEFEKEKREFIDESTLKWNDKALNKIAEWSNIYRFYSGSYEDTIQTVLKKGGNFQILSYNKNSTLDLNEFLRLLEDVLVMSPQGLIDNDAVKRFILEALRNDYILKQARKVINERDIFNPYTNNAVLKNMIAVQYNKELIENRIPEPTEAALHKFYEEQMDSIFYQLKVVYIHARIYKDRKKADDEIKKIKEGIPFDKVSNTWYNKGFIRQRDGKLESYHSAEPPYLADAAFKLGINEVAGPIEYTDTSNVKNYAVIKCDNILPEKQLTYEEAEKNIKGKFIEYYKNKLSDEVDLQLKKKYDYEIFENVLMKALSAK